SRSGVPAVRHLLGPAGVGPLRQPDPGRSAGRTDALLTGPGLDWVDDQVGREGREVGAWEGDGRDRPDRPEVAGQAVAADAAAVTHEGWRLAPPERLAALLSLLPVEARCRLSRRLPDCDRIVEVAR